MKRNIIYLVDEDPAARRANRHSLISLLDTPEIVIEPLEPLKMFADYNELLAASSTAGFILDQRMKESGLVSYDGTELASHLRAIDGKIPIYILTGYADQTQDFAGSNHLVEYVIDKEDIENISSESAKIIKARMLRQLETFNDVRSTHEQRLHDLLVKSLREPLSAEEQIEMDEIEGNVTVPLLAAERAKERELGAKIEQLRKIIDGGQLPL